VAFQHSLGGTDYIGRHPSLIAYGKNLEPLEVQVAGGQGEQSFFFTPDDCLTRYSLNGKQPYGQPGM
jgi:hypothetical protein